MFLVKGLLKGGGGSNSKVFTFDFYWTLAFRKKLMERVGDFIVFNFEDIAFTLTDTQLILFC
jgi:hypothetical protein